MSASSHHKRPRKLMSIMQRFQIPSAVALGGWGGGTRGGGGEEKPMIPKLCCKLSSTEVLFVDSEWI